MRNISMSGWGLIGASTIARQFMVSAIRSQPNQTIRAIQSNNIDRAEEFAVQHGIPAAFASVNSLLADPEVHAVYISSTNDLHYSHAMAAIAAGKHVLCEKPIALNVGHAKEMARAARDANLVLATNHHLRNAASHQKIRELIRSDAIGKILFARIFHAVDLPTNLQSWRVKNASAGGGVILDITVHDIDTLRFAMECEPVEVVGLSQKTNMSSDGLEDGVMAVIRFENGALVQLHDAFTVKYSETGIEFHGEKGSIYGRNVMTQNPVGTVILRDAEGEVDVPLAPHDLYETGVAAFLAAVRGERAPAATAEDGIRSLLAAQAVVAACATGSRQEIHIEKA